MPTLLIPSGGYLQAATACFASIAVLIWGIIIPSQPVSKILLIQIGLLSGDRTKEAHFLSVAWIIFWVVSKDKDECSISIQSQSKSN